MVSLPVPHPSTVFSVNNYIICLLALTSITGDYIVAHTKLHLFQAVFDNATHGIIGGLSWFYVCLNFKKRSHIQTLVEIAFCTLVASVIDLDHFIAARSLHLKDATSLQKRPPLHCTTFPVIFCLIVLTCSYFFHFELGKRISLIVLTAFLSHHTRDATRRGFWCYPFGSTAPIPYYSYVGLTCTIPIFVCFLCRIVESQSTKFSLINKGAVI